MLLVSLVLLSPTATTHAGEVGNVESETEAVRVTYVSGSSIYVGMGSDDGIEVGDWLDVVRDGRLISVVRVEAVSSLRASCSVVGDYAPPQVGDLIRRPESDRAGGSPSIDAAEGEVRVLAFARISHIDQSTVFIDCGQDEDLRGGDQLQVLREGDPVALLEVTDVSASRSACTVVEGRKTTLEPGDIVQLPVRGAARDVADRDAEVEFVGAVNSLPVVAPRRSGGTGGAIHGRVGVRYLLVQDRLDGGGDFSQPALDLRIDGRDLARGHFDVAVDVRSRRTYRITLDEEGNVSDQTRVYRLSMAVHDRGSHYRLTLGRQFVPSLATVGTFDGALLDFNWDRSSMGLFAGTQPALDDYGYSDEIREYGAFVQLHSRRSGTRPWSVTLGAVGSYFLGEVNREFAYLQMLYAGSRLTFYGSQEVDYNRQWKQAVGEDQVSPTSSYMHLSYRLGRGFTFRAGYDNRRNIRLYRDFITPEVEFDDTFRRGAWAGFTQRIGKRFRFGMDAKESRSEISGSAETYTLTLGVAGLSRANVSSYYRGSYYVNQAVEGTIHSANVGVSMSRNARLTLNGGLRDDTNLVDPTLDGRLLWYGIETDFNFGRHWFLMVSSERAEGDTEANDQMYLSMTYRF
jgi:hypothetical protein